jgi:tRNA/rRNA methyltransferase
MLDSLPRIKVILVRPRFPENIGAAARAVANMGLGGLAVVQPERLWPEPMGRLASSCGVKVLADLQVCENLPEALADCTAAAATTARRGRDRGQLLTPRQAAPKLLNWAQDGKVGLVFGPEDRGLTTEELDACMISVCIPTTADSSLNLAQAVVVQAYELRMAALEALAAKEDTPKISARRQPAGMDEMAALHNHLKKALAAMDVILPDNPDHFYRPIKNVLERARPTSAEVRALHGIARQGLWFSRQVKD